LIDWRKEQYIHMELLCLSLNFKVLPGGEPKGLEQELEGSARDIEVIVPRQGLSGLITISVTAMAVFDVGIKDVRDTIRAIGERDGWIEFRGKVGDEPF